MEELAELLLKHVAQSHGIEISEAAEHIDTCLKYTAGRIGADYTKVYAAVYSHEFLAKCLRGKCADVDLERCEKMCHCVVYEGKCVSRYIEDAEFINRDPDKYVLERAMPTKDLEELVRFAAYLYYNYDGGGLTDNSFDALEYHLNKRLKLRGKRYEKIGAEPVEKLRSRLPYPMASLDKLYPGQRELITFIDHAPGLVWSDKLDGVSGLVLYENGQVSGIYTRGDGVTGGDVTYLKDFITLPSVDVDVVVRGEFILTKRVWTEKYQAQFVEGTEELEVGAYTNPRSFVSGKVNQGFVSSALKDVQFVAYQVVDIGVGKVPSPSQGFQMLEDMGFQVPEHGRLDKPTVFEIMTLYKKRREASAYNIDGLVLSVDVAGEHAVDPRNPMFTKAFKMRLEEQQRKSRVIDVEWRISRYGRFVPVSIYEGVYVNGVRLHKASAHNAAHVRDWNMGRGTKITVIRAGDVIPTISDVEVDTSVEPIFPTAERGTWHWDKSDIVLDEIEGNREVQIKIIIHFFETIAVPGLREKTAEKLWEAGFKDVRAIVSAKRDDFRKLKGFGEKKSQKMYDDVHRVMRETRLDRFIPASTTLKVGIGRKLVKQLLREFPDVFDKSEAEIVTQFKARKIPGFGEKRVANVAESIPRFREFLFSLNKEDVEYALEHNKRRLLILAKGGYNLKIKGKRFVLTGFYMKTDYELEDYIYDHLGDFDTTVTSTTEAVISANIMDITQKMVKAQEMGVPVYSIDEFVRKYDVPYSKASEEPDEERLVEGEREE